MGLNSMHKLKPDSTASNHWQHEVCGQCPNWRLNLDHDSIVGNPTHKLMTAAECMRLKRELRVSLFTNNGGAHFWTFLMLVFVIVFCMSLTLWLLAKAFVFSRPQPDDTEENNSQYRQLGGRSSVDEIVQQLREKCTASTQNVEENTKNIDELYVPPKFWDRFPMNEFIQKSNKAKQESKRKADEVATEEDPKPVQKSEVDSESSNATSDVESTETSITEVLSESQDVSEEASSTSEETTCSTGDESERSTDDEKSTIDNIQQNLQNSLGQMTTNYNHATTNATPDQSRRKIRWANWLRRSKPVDFQV
ncbi:hypothetical protein ACLKA6_014568 [Drosophila palustris]